MSCREPHRVFSLDNLAIEQPFDGAKRRKQAVVTLLHQPVDLGHELTQRAVPPWPVAACPGEKGREVAELLEPAARQQRGGILEQ